MNLTLNSDILFKYKEIKFNIIQEKLVYVKHNSLLINSTTAHKQPLLI